MLAGVVYGLFVVFKFCGSIFIGGATLPFDPFLVGFGDVVSHFKKLANCAHILLLEFEAWFYARLNKP